MAIPICSGFVLDRQVQHKDDINPKEFFDNLMRCLIEKIKTNKYKKYFIGFNVEVPDNYAGKYFDCGPVGGFYRFEFGLLMPGDCNMKKAKKLDQYVCSLIRNPKQLNL